MKKSKIFLIGFMGAGKTSIGKKLANLSSLPFVDIDYEIEQSQNMKIYQIFEKQGEEFFRKEENKMLKSIISQHEKAVISTGGGLPCFYNNMKLMNEVGMTIYLHRPAKELLQRLKTSKIKRPLLQEKNDKELLAYIEETIEKRNFFYQQAQIIVSREIQTAEKILQLLL